MEFKFNFERVKNEYNMRFNKKIYFCLKNENTDYILEEKKKSYPNPDQRKPKALGLRQRRDAFLGFVVITVLII